MMLSDLCLSDICLSVAYIGPNSRTERLWKTKIGTKVAHVTRDSDTTFKAKRSKVKVIGWGHIVAASRVQLVLIIIRHTVAGLVAE